MGTDESAALPSAMAAIIAEKSAPVAVTTSKGIDGYRENATRIPSVDQVGCGNIMELSITGHVLKLARQSEESQSPDICLTYS